MVTGTATEGPAAGVPMQRCSVCKEWWPQSHAYFHKNGRGFDSRCKDCKHAARVNFKDCVTDIDAAKYLNQRPVGHPESKPGPQRVKCSCPCHREGRHIEHMFACCDGDGYRTVEAPL